jgi:hypothetical protein
LIPRPQEIVNWDSDPDFIEYAIDHPPAQPKGPEHIKPLKSSTATKPHIVKKSEPTDDTFLDASVSVASTASDASSVATLPSFARANWTNRFLPTLYHHFGSSRELWKLFTKGDKMLLIIQEVVNVVYPNATYRAKWGNKICAVV